MYIYLYTYLYLIPCCSLRRKSGDKFHANDVGLFANNIGLFPRGCRSLLHTLLCTNHVGFFANNTSLFSQ